MSRSTISGVASFGIVLLFAASAWAACTQADLTGRWQVYINGATTEGFWTRCTITIASNGNTSGSCVTDDNQALTVTGGRLTAASTCIVTGTVRTPGINTVKHATVDKGKTTITGVGIDPEGERFAFTGVKRF